MLDPNPGSPRPQGCGLIRRPPPPDSDSVTGAGAFLQGNLGRAGHPGGKWGAVSAALALLSGRPTPLPVSSQWMCRVGAGKRHAE